MTDSRNLQEPAGKLTLRCSSDPRTLLSERPAAYVGISQRRLSFKAPDTPVWYQGRVSRKKKGRSCAIGSFQRVGDHSFDRANLDPM